MSTWSKPVGVLDGDGARVSARPLLGLEHRDVVAGVQQVGTGEPGNAGSDDRESH